jgi:AcrR family transcriptional regulator
MNSSGAVKTVRIVSSWYSGAMCAAGPAPLVARRSESSRTAILDGALAVCREQGYSGLSIEAIAARAGVGKQTIYRWWPSKGAVLLDALSREAAAQIPVPDTGDIVTDLQTIVRSVIKRHAHPDFGPHFAALLAEAQREPALRLALLERFIAPRRAPMVERIRRAQSAGQLASSLDPVVALEIIFGALYHRLLLRNGPLNRAYAERVVRMVISGWASSGSRRRRKVPRAS